MVHADLEHAVARRRPAGAPGSAARPSDCCSWRRWRRSAPAAASTWRSASLVPVLPTLPVTPAIRARGPAPAARGRGLRAPPACRRPATRPAGSSTPSGTRLTTRGRGARARAPRPRTAWPSRLGPTSATNRSPGASVRRVDRDAEATQSPAVAAAGRRGHRLGGPERAHRRSASSRAPRRAAPRHRRTATSGRRRSGRSRGPCRRPAGCRPRRGRRRPSRIASSRSPISMAPRRRRQNRGADRGRILAARIVVGDDRHVGQPRRDLAHQRALAGDRGRRRSRTRRPAGPCVCGRSASSALARASGVWA